MPLNMNSKFEDNTRFAAVKKELGKASAEALREGARGARKVIRKRARDKSVFPQATGNNAKLVKIGVRNIRDTNQFAVTLTTNSGYGGWLEVGTRKQAAKPYIIPGVEEALPLFEAALKHNVRSVK